MICSGNCLKRPVNGLHDLRRAVIFFRPRSACVRERRAQLGLRAEALQLRFQIFKSDFHKRMLGIAREKFRPQARAGANAEREAFEGIDAVAEFAEVVDENIAARFAPHGFGVRHAFDEFEANRKIMRQALRRGDDLGAAFRGAIRGRVAEDNCFAVQPRRSRSNCFKREGK